MCLGTANKVEIRSTSVEKVSVITKKEREKQLESLSPYGELGENGGLKGAKKTLSCIRCIKTRPNTVA